MKNHEIAYLVKPNSTISQPVFWEIAIFLWGSEEDFDSDGNAINPNDTEWTELTLSNRIDPNQRIDIDLHGSKPLVLKITGSTQALAARTAYFLAARTRGKVSLIEPVAWRSPQILKKHVGNFDLRAAIVRVMHYIDPQEIGQSSYDLAHNHCSYHRAELKKSELCGCFYCLHLFQTSEIRSWIDWWDGVGLTALCPACGIDSVLGSASGYPITKEFLQEMKAYWF
ncbi:MAG: hypothetical protein R3A44_27470 [Caldilineaceae bacterium]